MLLKRLLNIHKKQTPYGLYYSGRLNLSSSAKLAVNQNTEEVKNVQSALGVPVNHFDEIVPTQSMPMILSKKENTIFPFDDVPGPKSLKLVSTLSQYLSTFGTQVLAKVLTVWFNMSTLITQRKSLSNLSPLFDTYGPVVRFVSPVGGNIVLLNQPEHIEKIFIMEGEYPVRSQLDSLEKYRLEHKSQLLRGIYSMHGTEWNSRREALSVPLETAVIEHADVMFEIADTMVQKIDLMRNQHDEIPKALFREINKWAFDSMGLIVFSKKFTILKNELPPSQCEMSCFFHTLENATNAIINCESGIQMWKLFQTPAWLSLVKHCDNLDNLIGKRVLEFEQSRQNEENSKSLIDALLSKDNLNVSDITTILMDMMLLGVNTIASSQSFLLYFLAQHQKVQKKLYEELEKAYPNFKVCDLNKLKADCPYLQACIKETLRLAPPIPLITRVLNKNVVLDKYNIPRGTLILMSTQYSSLKESNYDDALRFWPDRWLLPDAKDYHSFASIPFGHGVRKCLGQNIAETMISLLTLKLLYILYNDATLMKYRSNLQQNHGCSSQPKRRKLIQERDDLVMEAQMQLISGQISVGHLLDKLR